MDESIVNNSKMEDNENNNATAQTPQIGMAAAAIHELRGQAINIIQSKQTGQSLKLVIRALRILFESLDTLLPIFQTVNWTDQTTLAFVMQYIISNGECNSEEWGTIQGRLSNEQKKVVAFCLYNCLIQWAQLSEHLSSIASATIRWFPLFFGFV